MKKTQKVCKKFISIILTFVLTFGSYVFPVFAALPDDNNEPTIQEIVDAYNDLKLQKGRLTDKINEIQGALPVSSAKASAIDEANEYLSEFNTVFLGDKLKVHTTEYNVISVVVDFNDVTNLGLDITNESMKSQILKDTYRSLQEYYYQLDIIFTYLNQSETYTGIINQVGDKFEIVSNYVEKLNELNITYDSALYGTYASELITLLIQEGTLENIEQASNLSTELDTYSSSISTILKNNLIIKYNELNDKVNASTLTGLDTIRTQITNSITDLNNTSCDLISLSDTYITLLNNFNSLIKSDNRNNPSTEYIDSLVEEINNQLSNIIETNISLEQINKVLDLTTSITLPGVLDTETLVSLVDKDLLSEKLISGELNYEVIMSFINIYNTNKNIINLVNELRSDISNTTNPNIDIDELNEYLDGKIDNEIFGSSSLILNKLNGIENNSKTEEERNQILNKLDLIKYLVNDLKTSLNPSNDSVLVLTDKINELKEYYSKSCDNKLTNITVNGIELDVNESNHKIYVGNDITDLEVLFQRSNSNSRVEILNGKNLKVGTNQVIILVTAENGEVRQYTLEVIRAEKESALASTVSNQNTTSNTEGVNATALNNNEQDQITDIETNDTKNTSDSAEKYNEEVKEEKGLSALTVSLIVIGIALIGFGIYKVFGDKEDQMIEKAFSKPNISKNKSNNKKSKK